MNTGGVVSRSISLAFLLLCTMMLAAAPTVQAEPTSWIWAAPADAAGPVALRVSIDFGDANDCTVTLEATGGPVSGPRARLVYGERGWAQTSTLENVQVHVDDLGLDTRNAGNRWAIRGTLSRVWTGVQDLTVSNSNMEGWLADRADPWSPAAFEVACDQPIEVIGHSGSRELLAFTQETLEGVGASSNGLTGGAAVNIRDRATRTFTSEVVDVTLIEWTFAPGAVYRSWKLETPHWAVLSESMHSSRTSDTSFSDGPGEYRFTMTQAAVASYAQLTGWIIGLEPVEHLDDVFA